MVRLEGEEEEVEEDEEELGREPARGSGDPQPVQTPDEGPNLDNRGFQTVAPFLGRQQDEEAGDEESNETYVPSEAPADYEYEEYRFKMVREGIGIEVCLMEKLRTFRQMKKDDRDDESVDDAIDTFVDCFKDVQCGGPKGRTRVINYV